MKKLVAHCIASIGMGCASLHHVQIGEIDNTRGAGKAINIKVSDTGVDFHEAAQIADHFSRAKDDRFQNLVAVIQFGPKTGTPVFNDTYPDVIFTNIRNACPSGNITGLSSIRESRKYPVISGEIVKITGWCVK